MFDGAALARLGAATEAANVLLGAAEANTLRLVGGEGTEALLDALIEKPLPTPVSGPACTAANEPIPWMRQSAEQSPILVLTPR